MIFYIANLLINVFGLNSETATLWAKRIFTALAIIVGLIILIIVIRFSSCGTPNNDKLKEEILIEKIEANILSNQKEEIEKDVNKKSNDSNSALDNFNNAVNRDSNSFTGNATDKFCRRFCEDSSCADWRKTNECKPSN